jgi:hypothetical protein
MPDGALPPGMVPRFLTREQAAAYVGVSAATFGWEVSQGYWPAPVRRGPKGGLATWDRLALDDHADKVSGREMATSAAISDSPAPALVADLAAAEAAALEGAARAARKRSRP